MSTRVRLNNIQSFIAISICLHLLVLILPAKLPNIFDYKIFNKNKISKFKVHSMRTVGEKDSKLKSKQIYVEQKNKAQKSKKQLSAKQLAPIFSKTQNSNPVKMDKKGITQKKITRPKAIKALSLNKKSISGFLRGTPNAVNSREFMDALGTSDTMVKLEVPKGVKEDELNKHELVFYSFQKRTAMNYINSFYKKLNEFELKNPHLKFPLTKEKQRMIGRVIYDKEGNIVKINILKWTNVTKLQDFFVEVLKEMNSIPNPPDKILKDDQFTVFYSLSINGNNG